MRLSMALWLLVAITLSGCLNYRPDDPYNRFYPKRPVWRLRNGEPDPDNVIRYDYVYVARIREGYYRSFRFWPTGQVMIQSDVAVNEKWFNTFQGSGIGYFRIDKDVFWLEAFGGVNFGSYGSERGYVNGDGNLVVTHFGIRSRFPSLNLHSLPEPWVFVRTPADLKELTPDW